jgi:hypothetical protein
MVVLVETIDAISRRLGRDVLFLTCTREARDTRKEAKKWLTENGFAIIDCVPFASGYIQFEAPASEVFIDLEYDPSSEAFKMIDAHFEKPDGEGGVFQGIRFALLPLENALENKEQDEPGYWDRVLDDDG